MKNEILRILANQCDPAKISFEDKNGNTLVNLPCYALTGCAAEDLNKWARENKRTCVITIQSIVDPYLQIIL